MKTTGVDAHPIKKIAATADKLMMWFVKAVSLLCFFLLFLLVFANVLIRVNPIPELKVSLHSFDELREWVQVSMIFYGAAGIWILRDHFKLDMINEALFTRNRVIHAVFNLFIEVASLIFIVIFTYASLHQTMNLMGVTNDLLIPEKYIYLSGLLIPGIVMTIYAIRNVVLCVLDLVRPGRLEDNAAREEGGSHGSKN